MARNLSRFAILAWLAACDPALVPEEAGGDASPSAVDLGPTFDAADPGPDAGPDAEALDAPDAEALDAPDAEDPDAPDAEDPEAPDAEARDAEPLPPDAAPTPPDAAEGPAVYPADRLVSPLTPAVVRHLKAVAATPGPDDHLFAKVGASATASVRFLHCFAGPDVDLGGRDALALTVAWFQAGVPNPYTRESLAAVPGRTAGWAITGDPAPLDQELAALDPRFAVVMYGTNDLQLRDLEGYANHLLTLADRLLAEGVIPVFSAIMPRDDDAEADARVPHYNAVVRAVAQARQVPFVDLHRALLALPDHGIGPDGIHPTTAQIAGRAQACDFTPAGLEGGYNWRNLLTISALHGLVESVLGEAPAPDPPHPARAGTGGPDDPWPITALPFTDVGDTTASPHRRLDAYPGCDAPQDESGPERTYRLVVPRAQVVRIWVFDRGEVDVDLHLLTDPRDPATCRARAHREITQRLEAGTYYLVVDTFVRGGRALGGEYLLVVLGEDP